MSKRNFFTLIEMLVVIAIISVLASMLSPALRKAHNSALNAVCVNNLKQIGAACAMYAGEYNGYLPQIHHFIKWDAAINKWRTLRTFLASYAGSEEKGSSREGIWFCPANEFSFATDENSVYFSTYAPTFSWCLNATRPAEGFCYFSTRNSDSRAMFSGVSRIDRVPSKIVLIGNRNPSAAISVHGHAGVVTENITETHLTMKDESCKETDIFMHNGTAPFLYGGMAVRKAFPLVGNLPWKTINGVGAFAFEW